MPFAVDVDRIIELGGAYGRQESRLQHLVNEPLTGGRDGGLFVGRQVQAAASFNSFAFCHPQGNSSCSRPCGMLAMRASTSASQACGSTSLSLAVMIRVAMTAARSAPRSDPANSHDLRPRAITRSFSPCRAG